MSITCTESAFQSIVPNYESTQNSQVSVEEWSSMWDDYSKNPDNALEWQTQYLKFMFDLEDASGDGSIDIDEFTSVCSCYGIEVSECRDAFNKMAGVSKQRQNWPKVLLFYRFEMNGGKTTTLTVCRYSINKRRKGLFIFFNRVTNKTNRSRTTDAV